MPLHILAILALIQGITEFLPVSSSGHLILFPELTGSHDQGIAIDVAVHVGTLFAVMAFFWRDVVAMFGGALDILRGRFATSGARLVLLLAVATIPVVIAGLVLKVSGVSDQLRDIRVIAWAMIVFGLVLYWYDKTASTERTMRDWTLRDAIVMGLWQALALIPGTSRSGATITAARFLGFDRRDGARLAMLMSIPTILASGVLIAGDVVADPASADVRDMAIGAILSFAAALLSLGLMMQLLRSVSFLPYVIYRVALGCVLLWIAHS